MANQIAPDIKFKKCVKIVTECLEARENERNVRFIKDDTAPRWSYGDRTVSLHKRKDDKQNMWADFGTACSKSYEKRKQLFAAPQPELVIDIENYLLHGIEPPNSK